ncbi:hypothetical protein GH733_004826 [Mirounga leonina]|nr:hypothetical protein GH733_004826 [Mirounga leonina]
MVSNSYGRILPHRCRRRLHWHLGLASTRTYLASSDNTAVPHEFATHSVAALLAGTAGALFTPMEKVRTLLQDHKHNDKFTNTYQAFKALRCHGNLAWKSFVEGSERGG